MQDASPGTVMFLYLMAAGAMLALAAVPTIYVFQKPHRRGALAPCAIALALIAPVFATGAAAKHITQMFADMSTDTSGIGGMAIILTGCQQAQGYMRIGNVAGIVVLLIALVLSFITERGRPIESQPASVLKRVAWFLLLTTPVILFGYLHERVRDADRISVVVVEAPAPAPGSAPAERPPLAPIIDRVSSAMYLGVLGAPLFAIVFFFIAGGAAVLAWISDFPPFFHWIGRAVLLLVAVLCALAIVAFDRPVTLPT